MSTESRITIDALGLDARVKRCRVAEALSTLTEIRVEFETEDPGLDLGSALGRPASVLFSDQDGQVVRAFHGIMEQAAFVGERGMRSRYEVHLRPSLSGLSQRFASRIFQEQSVPEIVKQVLNEAGLNSADTRWDLTFDYAPRQYCVQYRESTLDFVLRLLEDEGIFYWVEHDDGGHTLCFGDGANAFGPIEGNPVLAFRETTTVADQAVSRLRLSTRLVHGGYRARDWNWQSPAQPVEAEQLTENSGGLVHYEYPVGAESSVGAGRLSGDRLQALTLRKYVLAGETNCVDLAPGRTFELVDACPEYVNGEYLVLSVQHEFQDTGERVSVAQRRQPYVARFEAIPAATPYRPERTTARPIITGTEVAVVTGPPGEEIHVDAFGRVKVHFYWDREQPVDDTSSCWLRVQQQNTHGSMLLPRVGWEVAVGFMHGDPDQPVVLHKLYNAATLPPYELPGNLSQASLETHSTGGGGGISGVRMQDTTGGQGFFVTAQRDLSWSAGHDATETIAVDATATVGGNRSTQVGDAEDVRVGGIQRINVTGTATFDVAGARTLQIDGRDQLKVRHNAALTCDGDRRDTVGSASIAVANNVDDSFNSSASRTIGGALVLTTPSGSLIEAVAGTKTERVGGAKVEIATADHSETIGLALVLTAGSASYKAGGGFDLAVAKQLTIRAGSWTETCKSAFGLSGKSLVIEAKDGLTAKAAGTKLNIKGGKITIDGSGFGAKGGPKLEMKGKINFKS